MDTQKASKKAKRLLMVTPIIVATIVISFVVASLTEFIQPIRDTLIYNLSISIFLFTWFLGALPCLIASLRATLLAFKAERKKFKILGFIEIAFSVMYLIFSIVYLLFLSKQ